MRTSSRVDWLSITYPYATKLERMLPKDTEYRFVEIKSPIPVYKTAYEINPIGAKLLIGDERLGKHVIYSGKAMTEIYELQIPILDIWETVQNNYGHITRVDFAVDVFESTTFTVPALRERYFSGECKTSFGRNKEIGENAETETFYFGKMNSKIAKCRVYNKALEQKIENYKWVRIEYEKRKNATNWMRAFMEGASIKSLIKASVDFPKWHVWQGIFGTEDSATIPREAIPETTYDKLLQWILSSAIPAISRAIILEAKDNDKFSIAESSTIAIINNALEYRLNKDLFDEKVRTHEKILGIEGDESSGRVGGGVD